MRVLIQRSNKSFVSVDNKITGAIDRGLVLLVGFTHTDTEEDIDYLIQKILKLRIFEDENNTMNKSILEVGGAILSISQFTLYANTQKGNRPSYIEAMKHQEAKEMYQRFNQKLSQYITVQTGIFGADMKVSISNDGPITIMLESRKKDD